MLREGSTAFSIMASAAAGNGQPPDGATANGFRDGGAEYTEGDVVLLRCFLRVSGVGDRRPARHPRVGWLDIAGQC